MHTKHDAKRLLFGATADRSSDNGGIRRNNNGYAGDTGPALAAGCMLSNRLTCRERVLNTRPLDARLVL
jgi:hypothetical protein